MRRLMLVAIFSSLAVTAWAQTETASRFTKVYIRSTASDALVNSGGTDLSGYFVIRNNDPVLDLRESDAATDEKYWSFISASGDLVFRGINDAYSSTAEVYRIGRTGATPGPFTFGVQVVVPNGSASAPGLAFVASSSTGFYLGGSTDVYISNGGQTSFRTTISGGAPLLIAEGGAFGTGAVTGAVIIANQNTSGADAPGCIGTGLRGSGGVGVFWIDSTGVMRTTTGLGVSACPTESGGDTIGTIVGTQTSSRAAKDVAGEITDTRAAMSIIRSTPVYQFTYKNGAYGGETFFGIITDESPIFGMDRGKSFNPVTAFGATVLALRDLDARMRALEARR